MQRECGIARQDIWVERDPFYAVPVSCISAPARGVLGSGFLIEYSFHEIK